MKEEWEEIGGHNGVYQVSNLGKVKSLKRTNPRVLKQYLDTSGYPTVKLCNGGMQNRTVHTLVWDAFGDNPRDGDNLQVDHINRDRTDNRISNLRLVTKQQNRFNSNHKGCSWHPRNKAWQSRIMVDGETVHLGYYRTEQEAINSYLEAKNFYHAIN